MPCAPDVLGVDWTVNLGAARQRVGHQVALQGNLDPMVLMAEPEQVQAQVIHTLNSFGAPHNPDGSSAGHIFNLGHGISQHTPPQNVQVVVDTVHRHSKSMRASQG